MNKNYWIGNLLLFITSVIWGCAYVAQSAGMDYVGPFTFNSIRCFIAFLCSSLFLLIVNKIRSERPEYHKPSKCDMLYLLKGGTACGILLSFATLTQQFGISMTTVGKAGFISVLYIFYVPFIQLLFHIRLPRTIWISVPLALIGMYFLCIEESFSLSYGDLVLVISSIFFGIHILVIGHYAPHTDGIALSSLQFLVCSLVSMILMLFFEKPSVGNILNAWIPILYAGAISGGIGYTLQIVGQKWSSPSVASLIMSLESVIAVIAGIIFLDEVPTTRQVIGCVIMFLAIILIQLPEKKKES